MLPSLELFSLIVKEGLAPLVIAIGLLGGGMPLFPTSNYSKSLLEPATARWSDFIDTKHPMSLLRILLSITLVVSLIPSSTEGQESAQTQRPYIRVNQLGYDRKLAVA